MGSLVGLLASTLGMWACILSVSAYGMSTSQGGNLSNPVAFLLWLPGVSIALVAGTAGALLDGLLDIARRTAPRATSASVSQELAPVQYVIKPFLGALSAGLLFFAMASGFTNVSWTEIVPAAGGDPGQGGLGGLLWVMTPRTPGGLAKLVLFSFAAGYFHPAIPVVLEVLRRHALGLGSGGR